MIKIRLYSIYREKIGKDTIILDLNNKIIVKDLIKYLELDKIEPNIKPLVLDSEGRKLDENETIPSTGEIHVMPPPSGGSNILVKLASTEDNQTTMTNILYKFLSESITEDTGALLVFAGIVRGLNKGRKVIHLEYESAGDLTLKVFKRIAEEIASREGIRAVAGIHYTGVRKPGELTMLLGVAGVSRHNVFPALIEFIERVKHELPIWKKEKTSEGNFYLIGGDKIELS